MESIIYGIAITVYAIFIIRFILSWVGGDFEIDGGDFDLDISDVVSFKGLTHFLMGSSGWLSIKQMMTHDIQWYDFLIAILFGVVFVFVLYLVYKLMFKLECKPAVLKDNDLIGHCGRVYLQCGKDFEEYYKYLVTVGNNLGTVEVTCKSPHLYEVGDIVMLSKYEEGIYTI